jgi:hypothetical protein
MLPILFLIKLLDKIYKEEKKPIAAYLLTQLGSLLLISVSILLGMVLLLGLTSEFKLRDGQLLTLSISLILLSVTGLWIQKISNRHYGSTVLKLEDRQKLVLTLIINALTLFSVIYFSISIELL